MKISRLFILFLPTIILAQWVAAREPGQLSLKHNLSFIANAGQITDQHYNLRKDIDYKLNAAGMDVFVGDGQIHYQWSKSLSPVSAAKTMVKERSSGESKVDIYRMDVELVGANKNAKVIAEEPQAFYERYYTMETGEEGLVAHSYQKITYKDIYPNIDWVLYTRDKQLKYDFVVRPGGNVADIQLKYAGATSLQLEDGALMATTPFGSITEQKPYSYEVGIGKEITSRYVLKDNILSFEAGICNSTLIIDPTLQWATYYGSSNFDGGAVVAAGALNIYMAGRTKSTNNIATSGAFQTTVSWTNVAGETGFITRFSPSGNLLWGTYFNGIPLAITSDNAGAAYITGYTSSAANVATPGSHQPFLSGDACAFLIKFDMTGQRLWGTYYGDTGTVACTLTLDANNNIYIGGETFSSNYISTPGSHQSAKAGNVSSGFVAKFNNAGIRQWGSYYGGNGTINEILALSVDAPGNLYALGSTNSNNNIATGGSHLPNLPTSQHSAFLVKFTNFGIRQWGTYYGGTTADVGYDVTTDAANNVYICGIALSASGIATPGSFRPIKTGGGEGFLASFNGAGQRRWGTYYDGGPTIEGQTSILTDQAGYIYVAGSTNSTNVATPGSYQQTLSGSSDATLAKFSSTGQRLWSTYYGGTDYEGGNPTICLDTTGSIYLCGTTHSTNAIATPGSYKPVYTPSSATDDDLFLAKFENEDTVLYIHPSYSTTTICTGDSLFVPYGITHLFQPGNVFTLQLSDATGSFASPLVLATRAASTGGILAGPIPASLAAGTGYKLRVIASNPADTSFTRELIIKTKPAAPSAGSNTPVCSGQAINLNALTGAAGASYHWTGPASYSSNVQSPTRANATTAMGGVYNVTVTVDGCTSAATPTTVVVNPGPAAPVAGSNSPICAGTSLNLTASLVPGTSYSWNGPGAFTSNQQNPVINTAATSAAGTYTVKVTDGNGCVSANATTTVVINNSAAPTVGVFPNPNDSVCPGTMVTFIAVPNNGGTPTYQWYKNSLQIPGATNATYMTNTVSTGDFYSVAMTSTAVCAVPATVNSNNVIMTVVPPVVPSVTISASPGLNVGPWRMITFTATPVNGGPSPTYQWLRNGQPVIGAVSNTWGANNLSDNDVISVVLFSSEVCAIPPTDTSNTQLVHINMGIDDDNNNTANIQLYPNPNNGDFVIKGDLSEAVSIEVVNAIGQVVFSSRLAVGSWQSFAYPIHLDVASGVYLLKVASDKGVEMVRFRVE